MGRLGDKSRYLRAISSPASSLNGSEVAADEKCYAPRDYQISLAEKAVEQNLLIPLRTGSGKTLIAVLLIKMLSRQIRIPLQKGGKRSIFVVNTVVLVKQQAAYIRKHSDLKVAELCGCTGGDFYSKAEWDALMNNFEVVIVVVAQLFSDGLNHAFVAMEQFNVVVFDECHHATGNHPYCLAMNHYVRCPPDRRPRILGLTASVLNKGNSSVNALTEFAKLEQTLCSRIEASTWFLAACAYSAEAKVRVLCCEDKTSRSYAQLENELTTKCQEIIDFIADVKYSFSYDKKALGSISKIFNRMQNVVDHLGLWPALKACNEQLEELAAIGRTATSDETMSFVALGLTQIRCLKFLLEAYVKNVKSCDELKRYVSPRLWALIELLREYNGRYFAATKSNDDNDPFCGIVFVERRYTAYLIHALLVAIQSWEPKTLNHLKVCFVVGCNNVNSFVAVNRHEYRQQEENILRFQSGGKNFIIATSVLEEGFDVQRCNVVVRFDPPISFRSYIQSKGGRARKHGSEYVIVCKTDEEEKVKKLLLGFLETESKLANYESSADFGDMYCDRDTEMDRLVAPYNATLTSDDGSKRVARITLSTATRIVHMFCDKLPEAVVGKAKIMYKFRTHFDALGTATFTCIIEIPSIQLSLTGLAMPTRDLAKRAAALETCKVLHVSGRLNEHLLPFGVRDLKPVS
ncbi:Type III restriction enzyme, res subunit family p rotein [Trichuris trichiura]|uniref:Type III restriction enzyme, res subunit family p rotein n=1 Tax=Trichuris trichiura TaxID=36087 RepID=A0A077ZFJ6_TRITR|nr:Type III restriction enzyme, res subunit family p rotein [Trichuris trichiura]